MLIFENSFWDFILRTIIETIYMYGGLKKTTERQGGVSNFFLKTIKTGLKKYDVKYKTFSTRYSPLPYVKCTLAIFFGAISCHLERVI